MPSDPPPPPRDPQQDATDDSDLQYTLEVFAALAGVDTTTVLHYQEKGFLRPVRGESEEDLFFDLEGLRQLRRMEHLRATCGVNETGLKLILDLLREVETLREERRQLRR